MRWVPVAATTVLVETLGGPSVPAVGFAVGLERVSLMLPETSSILVK